MMKTLLSLIASIAIAVLLLGCGSTQSTMTKEEEHDFNGKPIPPDVLAKMKANMGKPESAPSSH